MNDITISEGTSLDKEKLTETWQHFKDKRAMQIRADCYLTHNNVILAKKGENIIGKMLWHVKDNPNEGVAEFDELYVYEDFRRQGIGSDLINSSIHAVRKYFKNIGIKPRRIFLYTGEDNLNARRLYEKHGFEYVANLGHLFTDNDNELFYLLDLT
ncbi:MAG: GNAT family N-acetyltransferase [Promethearchaeota archaeon]|jgi:ribosomal protein S18 acetylase RimI-like enzyme